MTSTVMFHSSIDNTNHPIKLIICDVDDTLYAKTQGVSNAINKRICEFIIYSGLARNIDAIDAVRSKAILKYGSTLRWIISKKSENLLHDYLKFIHTSEIAELVKPNPLLGELLSSISVKKIILSNSTRVHVDRVLANLGIESHFDDVYDVTRNNYYEKPDMNAYVNCIKDAKINPDKCLFIDDNPYNLFTFKQLGGNVVLVGDATHHFEPLDRISQIEGIKGILF